MCMHETRAATGNFAITFAASLLCANIIYREDDDDEARVTLRALRVCPADLRFSSISVRICARRRGFLHVHVVDALRN